MDSLSIEVEYRHTQQAYRDFIVNGRSLLEVLMPERLGQLYGMDTHLFSKEKQVLAEQLLCIRRSEMDSGRVPLYVCALSGDLDDGALTVSVEIVGESVHWRDFYFECNFEEGPTRRLEGSPSFVFPLVEYSAIFREFLN